MKGRLKVGAVLICSGCVKRGYKLLKNGQGQTFCCAGLAASGVICLAFAERFSNIAETIVANCFCNVLSPTHLSRSRMHTSRTHCHAEYQPQAAQNYLLKWRHRSGLSIPASS